MIYFVRDATDSRIKIGTTVRLSHRLRELAAEFGDGLEVLAVINGGSSEEWHLHQRFAHLRVVGEWFEPGDDLLGFIVSDGRPWDGRDDRTHASIKFDKALAYKARIVALDRGIPMAEYLSELNRAAIERDYAQAVKKMGDGM